VIFALKLVIYLSSFSISKFVLKWVLSSGAKRVQKVRISFILDLFFQDSREGSLAASKSLFTWSI